VVISSFENSFTRLHLSTVTNFLGMVLRLCSVCDPCQTSIFATPKLSSSVAHYTVIGAKTLSAFSSIEKQADQGVVSLKGYPGPFDEKGPFSPPGSGLANIIALLLLLPLGRNIKAGHLRHLYIL